ncbi:hypothetical protein L6164_036710 [Bauhinia variegata]|uniref:Uncharacterized protein n=1 Tax=Bauhinia variegata TaxID=167791 RepID=A0ACB9KHT0_BAUVA|nr:hypothetical protein L6164_036710 [Bauhinia variegata]
MGSISVAVLDPFSAAKKAVSIIGFGYDVNNDIRFSGCRPGPSGSRLIELDPNPSRDLVFPDAVVVPNVPNSIKCYRGERVRFSSDMLSFDQMSEQFNQELSLLGKIPSGLFNSMFAMTNRWQKDSYNTKSLAFDGWFISLYNVELERTNITLCEAVKKEVPSSWNPLALAEFIEKYGTHIVVGAKIGGKDVVHLKQSAKSDLQPAEVQRLLEKLAEERFSEDSSECSNVNPAEITGKLKGDHVNPCGMPRAFTAAGRPQKGRHSKNDDLLSISVRRGGIDVGQSFNQWLSTISQSPNIISMSFVPIISLLHSVPGQGFLRHAVNLYLAYKPPIEELHGFLQFQLPREWAKVHGGLGFGPRQRRITSPSLQFTFMGKKLYVNTEKVDTGYRPVTGIRLFLEGRKSNYLAVHLQHLSNLPSIFHISDDDGDEPADEPIHRAYFEPVKWKMFSHVCTAPVEHHTDDDSRVVTKAWFEVKLVGMKKVLLLKLGFSKVSSARIRTSEWDGPSTLSRKSGFFSALISTRLSKELHPPQKPTSKTDINSAAYNGNSFDSSDPPVPTKAPKMLSFVDTTELVRGPGDTPGHWVVTGAKLCVDSGRISIRVKYSLLSIMSEDLWC